MNALAGVLAAIGLLAAAAATGLMLRVFWGTFGGDLRRAPRRRLAITICGVALAYAPGIVAFATAPWGEATDSIVLLTYTGAVVLCILAFAIVSASRGIRRGRRH